MLQLGRDIRQLTGLRGIAALAVVFHHASNQAGAGWYLRGQPMVDIFFALSGFVMGYVYLSEDTVDWRAFAITRFARIYPLHAVTAITMAGAAVAYALASGRPWPEYINVVQALREATLTMAMPIVGAEKLWNFPAWSISVEWWVYFTLFPLLASYGRKLSNRQALAIFLMAAVALSLALHAGTGQPSRSWLAFARALVGFGGGWTAFRVATTTNRKLSPLATDVLFMAIFIAIYLSLPILREDAWFLIPFYPLMIFGLSTTDCRVSRCLASKPLEWLGKISFSIYLIHPIVINVLEAVDAKVLPIESRAAWIGLVVPISILVSAISYNVLERPARRFFRTGRIEASTPGLAP